MAGLSDTPGLHKGEGLHWSVGGLAGIDSLAEQLLAGEDNGLALDFADLSARVKDVATPANNFSGNVNALLTYSSPSTKYVLNAQGIYVPGTTLRTEYDASGNPLGVRIEEARTNLALHSRTLNNAVGGWTETNVTPTQPGAADMLGGTAAWRLAATAGGASSISRTFTGTAVAHTFTFFVKNDTAGWCVLASNDGTTTRSKNFNLATGALGADGANAPTSSSITAYPNGWYRISITATMAATTCSVTLSITDGDNASDPDAGEAIIADLAQVEPGSFATSPIITEGSTVTRAIDNITLATSKFPSVANAGTLFVDLRTTHAPASNSGIAHIGSGNMNDRVDIRGNGNCNITDGGVSQASIGSGITAANTRYKIAYAFAPDDACLVRDGSVIDTDTSVTLPDFTILRVGSIDGGSPAANCHIRALLVVPRRMTNTELQALTA